MFPKLFNIYGDIAINSYGLCIALGLIIFVFFASKDKRLKKLLSTDQFLHIIILGTWLGILGGRLLYIFIEWNSFVHWTDFFKIWHGGFSILGTILALLITAPLLLKHYHLPILPFLDIIALYAPLLQSISRVGCFLAGCCYGSMTHLPWAITYTNPECMAPLHISLHPTQLYSSIALLGIFLLLYFVLQYRVTYPGQLTMLYLMLESGERFVNDFFRSDRPFFHAQALQLLSIYQWIALGIFVASTIVFLSMVLQNRKKYTHGYI